LRSRGTGVLLSGHCDVIPLEPHPQATTRLLRRAELQIRKTIPSALSTDRGRQQPAGSRPGFGEEEDLDRSAVSPASIATRVRGSELAPGRKPPTNRELGPRRSRALSGEFRRTQFDHVALTSGRSLFTAQHGRHVGTRRRACAARGEEVSATASWCSRAAGRSWFRASASSERAVIAATSRLTVIAATSA
jgi:hypothetical protein